MTTYFQCKLRRGNSEMVAWIEERGAKVGNVVELKTANGEFWMVSHVYEHGLDEAVLRAKQRDDHNSLPSIKPTQWGEKI